MSTPPSLGRPIEILLVEDSPSEADALQAKLLQAGPGRFAFAWVQSLDAALARVGATAFDVLLLDLSLPGSTGADIFRQARRAVPTLPIVVLTDSDDESLGLEAIRHGIQDYLVKDLADGRQIARAIRYAIERQRAEEAWRASEERYRALVDMSPDAIVVHQDGRVLYANPTALRLFAAENLAQLAARSILEAIAERDRASAEERLRGVMAGQPLLSREIRLRRLDDQEFDAEVVTTRVKYFGQWAAQTIVRDITERKKREQELQKLNRTLQALSGSAQAMMRDTNEAEYLKEVCRIVVRDCGYALVWIGFVEEDAAKTIRPVAQAGFDAGYLKKLDITWADVERGRCPTGTAIRTGKPTERKNLLTDPDFGPWREEARKRGFASSLVLPLAAGGRTFGAITLYSTEPDPFTPDEVRLLTELAADISYGITVFRVRAAHARAEQAVKDREEELAAIYENAPQIMLLVDHERRIHKANKLAQAFAHTSLTDLFGRRAGEALRCLHTEEEGQPCGSGAHCRHCALRRTIMNTFETGHSHQQAEVTLPFLLDGERQDLTFLLSTLRLNVRGQPLALVTMQDITARKRAEEAVQHARAELELRVAQRTVQLRALAAELTQSEERERRRIAKILHDELQQLLVAARLRLEATRGRADAAPLLDDLRRIEHLIVESNRIARGLSHELSPTVLYEAGLVAGLRWLGRWMHETHGLIVRVDVAAAAAADTLEHDVKVLLYQSVRELLFNVVKHAGVKRATVRLGHGEPGWIEIRVSDKGKGFNPALAAAGYRAGARFGLFGIRERLVFLGGRMEVESKRGGGCRFRLIAPLGKLAERKPPATTTKVALSRREGTPPGSGAAEASPSPPAQIRVLLADDHKIMRDGLAALLAQRPGIAVVGVASDGHETLELAASLQPDVVVMDVNMPRLDGIEATRQLRATWPHIEVIGLTMHAHESIHNAMRAAGAVDCLVKSSPTEGLVRAIRALQPANVPLPRASSENAAKDRTRASVG